MEFETDDDVDEQLKNANDVKVEGKVRVRKKTIHCYEFSSDRGRRAQQSEKLRKPKMATKIQAKMMKMTRLLSPMK